MILTQLYIIHLHGLEKWERALVWYSFLCCAVLYGTDEGKTVYFRIKARACRRGRRIDAHDGRGDHTGHGCRRRKACCSSC